VISPVLRPMKHSRWASLLLAAFMGLWALPVDAAYTRIDTGLPAIEAIVHGDDAAGATLTRSGGQGFVTARALHHIDATETFAVNTEGWIRSESRSGSATVGYNYRADGARSGYSIGDATARVELSAAGAPEKIHNAMLGAKLRACTEIIETGRDNTGKQESRTISQTETKRK
jgi:hypothetical protein